MVFFTKQIVKNVGKVSHLDYLKWIELPKNMGEKFCLSVVTLVCGEDQCIDDHMRIKIESLRVWSFMGKIRQTLVC